MALIQQEPFRRRLTLRFGGRSVPGAAPGGGGVSDENSCVEDGVRALAAEKGDMGSRVGPSRGAQVEEWEHRGLSLLLGADAKSFTFTLEVLLQ